MDLRSIVTPASSQKAHFDTPHQIIVKKNTYASITLSVNRIVANITDTHRTKITPYNSIFITKFRSIINQCKAPRYSRPASRKLK